LSPATSKIADLPLTIGSLEPQLLHVGMRRAVERIGVESAELRAKVDQPVEPPLRQSGWVEA
jgi:hypothetical protein